MFETTRRRALEALGIGGTAAVAGCSAEAPANTDEDPTPTQQATTKPTDVDSVARDPADLPDPIDRDEPKHHDITLEAKEVTAEIEPGVTFDYMTFDGQIPGPMVRARVGDTIDLTLTNDESNAMAHNVDFHACYGPGGGAEATNVAPGESARLRFQVRYPGYFIYHCAVPNLDYHISAGMFGSILVEPEDGLPEVDHEFYLGQHEVYTDGDTGQEGHHKYDFGAQAREEPTYVLLNGEKYAITPDKYAEMNVQTGDTARMFFVVGGPNYDSSFHPIGNVWDEVYPQGAIESDPHRNVQTTPVKPGSCVMATMHFPVPGGVKIVDHALSRVARKGALAVIAAEGEERPEIFDPEPDA